MREIALLEEGARLFHATSYHEEFMPQNVIDRYWGQLTSVFQWSVEIIVFNSEALAVRGSPTASSRRSSYSHSTRQ